MSFDFDGIEERKDTCSMKWDAVEQFCGKKDLLPLWVADMDFKSPPQVIEALSKRVEHGIFGYAGNYPGYFQATANWMQKRFHWQVEEEWILPSPGVIPALIMLIKAFTVPGDKVVVQPPVYPPFFKSIRNNGCHVVHNPLKLEKGKYVMDFEDLERKIDDRVRLLILCSPHNPVGRVWGEEELKQISEICMRYNVLIISDEIHADLVYKGNRHIPLPLIAQEFWERVVVLTAPSKTFNLAGLQTSSTIIADASLRKMFQVALENNGFMRPNIFGLAALEAAYNYGEPWLEALLSYLEQNLYFLKTFIKEKIRPLEVIHPEGTYLAWVDCRALGMAGPRLENFLVHKAGLAFNHGYIFGPGGEGFVRINMACSRQLLEEALQRLESAINAL